MLADQTSSNMYLVTVTEILMFGKNRCFYATNQ